MNLINIAHAGVITDAPSLVQVAVNALGFLLSAVSILAIMMLVISGTFYFFAAGDERRLQRAKKAAVYAVVGTIISLSSLMIVRLIGSFF